MRTLIFHGYLLRGTGSNVYTASLAAALTHLGHEVHLLAQDRTPLEFDWVDAVGDWDGGALRIEARREPARTTVYRPDLGGPLPVYVADRYEGVEARLFAELTDEQLEGYLDANVRAVREVVRRARPDLALANHLVMGPVILARALAGSGVPYAVKVHGSALEYTVKPHPRFLPWAREGVAGARAVLVGSRHTARSLWAALEDPDLPARTRLGPPGVDTTAFRRRGPREAANGLADLRRRLQARPAGAPAAAVSSFAADPAAGARALAGLDGRSEPLVAFVGKLLATKGIDLLLAAWPLVLQRHPRATLVVVGFGDFAAAARSMVAALAAGTPERALLHAREAAGQRLAYLSRFVDGLTGASRSRYVAGARALEERVRFTGRLDHGELVDLLPACRALVVPSTFPEAFGMVAAEAAACGVPPVVAAHSGLAEVAQRLAEALPAPERDWLAVDMGTEMVAALADRVASWLSLAPRTRAERAAALASVAAEDWGWDGVARTVLAAGRGCLEELVQVE